MSAVKILTLCRGKMTIPFRGAKGMPVSFIKSELATKFAVGTSAMRIVAAGQELGDDTDLQELVQHAEESGEDVPQFHLVLKASTADANEYSLKVSDKTAARKESRTISGIASNTRVHDLKKRLHKEFGCMPPREQKLILKGKVLTDAHLVGEYIMGAGSGTLLVMKQPDGERELDLKILFPGSRTPFGIYFKASTDVRTVKNILQMRFGIPASQHMFQFYYDGEGSDGPVVMKNDKTLLEYHVRDESKLYLVPGTPVMLPEVIHTADDSNKPNPKPQAYLHSKQNLFKFFPECRPKAHSPTGSKNSDLNPKVSRSHQPAPRRGAKGVRKAAPRPVAEREEARAGVGAQVRKAKKKQQSGWGRGFFQIKPKKTRARAKVQDAGKKAMSSQSCLTDKAEAVVVAQADETIPNPTLSTPTKVQLPRADCILDSVLHVTMTPPSEMKKRAARRATAAPAARTLTGTTTKTTKMEASPLGNCEMYNIPSRVCAGSESKGNGCRSSKKRMNKENNRREDKGKSSYKKMLSQIMKSEGCSKESHKKRLFESNPLIVPQKIERI